MTDTEKELVDVEKDLVDVIPMGEAVLEWLEGDPVLAGLLEQHRREVKLFRERREFLLDQMVEYLRSLK